jgi:YD repeat-containing protein
MSFLKGGTMDFFKRLVGLLAAVAFVVPAWAGVNLKNGNFYISYTDIVVPGGGKKLEITRTYNSKSTDSGWFGFGWGSDYETRLETSADGAVVVHEHGAGAKTRFIPKTAIDGEAAAKKIVEEMRKRTQLTEQAANQLIEKLKNNAELRHTYALNFKVQTTVAAGTVLYSSERGSQELHVLKDGYVRKYPDGKQETYDLKGNLTKIADKTGYSIAFVWKDGKLESIRDSQAKQIFFSWYAEGRVKELWSAGDKKAEYKFDGDNLVFSKDVGGNTYEYGYDKSHNLTEIRYGDKSKTVVKYEPKTLFVQEITDRNGESTKYQYGNDPKAPEDHYWTTVIKNGFDGKPASNRYEYEIKTRPDGSRYTYRIVTDINGIKTETIYSECCSLPLKIARGKQVTNFEYNDRGLLVKKSSTKGDFVQIDYDDAINKIKKVTNNEGITEFTYDKQGNLVTARNDKGKQVLLVYDTKGKITKMVDHDKKSDQKRTLSFKYNALGKPVEIEMEKVGKINVAYDNYGEIKKVESDAGHKMALQVTQAFQNLLSIVKPAGVNLNM